MADKRFTASLNCRHRVTLTNVMGRAPVGGGTVTLTAQEDKDLRDMAGAVNQAAAAPGGCDGPQYPVDIQAEIAIGDFSRKTFSAYPDRITSFPFRVPAGPFTGPNGALLRMSASEFQGQPWARTLSVSATAGDLAGFLTSNGKAPDVSGHVGIEFQEGALLFANMILTDAPTVPNSSGSGFSIVWPAA